MLVIYYKNKEPSPYKSVNFYKDKLKKIVNALFTTKIELVVPSLL